MSQIPTIERRRKLSKDGILDYGIATLLERGDKVYFEPSKVTQVSGILDDLRFPPANQWYEIQQAMTEKYPPSFLIKEFPDWVGYGWFSKYHLSV